MRRFIVVAVFFLLAGSAAAWGSQSFSDVPADSPAAQAVQALENPGIVNGFPDGTFRGDQPVTRYELAVVVSRMMKYFEASLPKGTKLQTPPKELKADLGSITGPDAVGFLQTQKVPMPDDFLASLRSGATVNEVADVLSGAFTRLVELTSPGFQGDGGE